MAVSHFAPRALYKLQQAGIRTRLITKPFTTDVDGKRRSFSRGTILIRLQSRPADEVSAERLGQLPGSAAVVATRVRSGCVVLLMDNLNFRAFWYGTNGLFLNAVFFSSAF